MTQIDLGEALADAEAGIKAAHGEAETNGGSFSTKGMCPADGAAAFAVEAPPPAWFRPWRLLLGCSYIYTLIFLDRGALSSASVNGFPRGTQGLPEGSGIMGAFDLNYQQTGFLTAIFMIGLTVGAPTFAALVKHYNAMRLVGIGLTIWLGAIIGCGAAFAYWWLLLMRFLEGLGEAAFIATAAPFLDDHAPPARKALWMGTMFMCAPVGSALGYIIGGAIANATSWRIPFFVDGAAMAPVVVFCLFAPPLELRGGRKFFARVGFKTTAALMWRDIRQVLSYPMWGLMAMGFAVAQGVAAVYHLYAPKAGVVLFGVSKLTIDLAYGGASLIGGVLGCLIGGILVDKLGGSLRHATIVATCALLFGGIIIGCCMAFAQQFVTWAVLVAVGTWVLYMVVPAAAYIAMGVVPQHLRALAIGLQVVCVHVFGDVPLPPLMGLMVEGFMETMPPPDAWRRMLGIASLFLLVSVALYAANVLLASPERDFRHGAGAARRASPTPSETDSRTNLGPTTPQEPDP